MTKIAVAEQFSQLLWLQQSGTWNLLLQLFFTKWLPLNNEYSGVLSLFNLYCFPNSEVKFVGFGELGCIVGQYLLTCERVPVLLLLNAWSITGSKMDRILKWLTFRSGHYSDFKSSIFQFSSWLKWFTGSSVEFSFWCWWVFSICYHFRIQQGFAL